ncbi:transmembrane protein [Mycolicibacterium gilvum]|uniref:Transmembrane protein n=1 Tax=Mycolicibacterium gilvum TaxID=1804 RepID=A0A378SPR3_9MYCO|nr:alpha/beta-hydrolase family protein [Mycolicibacterium gilvum]STZ44345.1 transmembrane protein [Mycolicibacterium gilvum]
MSASPCPTPVQSEESANERGSITVVGLDLFGLVFALFFFAWSLSPSLLPRDWLFQGIISGVTSVSGYGAGLLLAFPLRRWVEPLVFWCTQQRRFQVVADTIGIVLALSTVVATLLVAGNWQRDIDTLMGMPPMVTVAYLRTGVVSVAIFVTVPGLSRGLRRAARWIARLLSERLRVPPAVAHASAPVVVAVAVAAVVNEVILTGSSEAARRVFGAQNNGTQPGVVQPFEAERSGSPESASRWETLGLQGRSFVAGGVGPAELAKINGGRAQVPVRVYAGLESAPDTAARVRLILDELDRTRAWDRRILVVAGATGTGWINPVAAESIELMYNGDSAIAAMQYSFLPSWISFLVDRSAATAVGDALITAIHQRWSEMPEDRRPRLVVYGESLGSQSAEAAYGDLSDLRRSVDGALFVGPPNSNRLWRDVEDRRDPGTTEVLPTYAGGLVVRFASNRNNLAVLGTNSPHAITEPWLQPRVLYLQHASDPIVWWSPELLWSRPDWLAEAPGDDRIGAMRWYPIVTFWQVTADLTRAQSQPPGYGHNYDDLIPYALAAVAAPPGWTAADTQRVSQTLEADAPNRSR